MKIETRQIEQHIYISFDGKEFLNERDCIHHEKIENGERKNCLTCSGTGEVTRDNDGGDGRAFGSMSSPSFWQEKCPECIGKGYLEKQTVWR